MKTFKVVITREARDDLRRYLDYIRQRFMNPQAIKSVRDDFYETAAALRTTAETIAQPENEQMRRRNLKRINFQRHGYFLIFRIVGDTVQIIQVFHRLEDYENKLR